MESFIQSMKHLGSSEAWQTVCAGFMWALANCCSKTVLGFISSILAVAVLFLNVRLGYTKNKTAQIELEKAQLELERER
jgi:uncharacterized membrane protein